MFLKPIFVKNIIKNLTLNLCDFLQVSLFLKDEY